MSGGRLLPGECARLAAGLRELKGRTGLSLAALGERTPYSKSSWERYLNGKKLPPRQAVEALCRLAGEPAGRLVALWELAEQAWSGRSGAAPPPTSPSPSPSPSTPATGSRTANVNVNANAEADTDGAAGGGPPEEARGPGLRKVFGRSGRLLVMSAAVAVAVALAVVLLLPGGRGASGGRTPGNLAATSPYPQKQVPGCAGSECDGAHALDMGCGLPEPLTIFSRRAAGGQRVQLRYSKDCAAVWGRITNPRIGDQAELLVPGAAAKVVTAGSPRDIEGYLATPMTVTKDVRSARVCLRPAGGGERECFAVPSSLVLPPGAT
ncbi:helix-turn-helix domain-containing protein [Streptomyces sp. NPDC026206]|uniref:helix-turn-helix domain-containing protein n=1 Tax=Streptomyces sp. NPDC026206 TaxID=3157089 RepID=UPI0033E733AB